MSKLLMKIAKVLPRLDSSFENEQMAAISLIRKILLSNMDDEVSPPVPQPLRFVDVAEQLLLFIDMANEAPEPAPPAPAPMPMSNPVPPSFSTVGAAPATPHTPPPGFTTFNPTAFTKPPRPAGVGWKWNSRTAVWQEIPINPYVSGWGSEPAHWAWDFTNETWTLRSAPRTPSYPTTPSWHDTPRQIHEYEARCKLLIDKRVGKTPKDKNFLESCYFSLSNGRPLTTAQLKWFHDLSNRLPF